MCYTKNRKENTPYITSMKRKTMKGLKIMTKLLKTITTIAALATTLITVSIYASAQSPVDNGSNARAEMVQNGLIAGQTAQRIPRLDSVKHSRCGSPCRRNYCRLGHQQQKLKGR